MTASTGATVRALFRLSSVCIVLLAACRSSVSGTPRATCFVDADCARRDICSDGTCVPRQAARDSGTPVRPIRDSGTGGPRSDGSPAADVAPPPAPSDGSTCIGRQPSPTAGGPCGCSGDCDSSEICSDEGHTGFPGGVCQRLCSSGCPAGTTCFEATAGDPSTGNCLPTCATPADCGTGRVCRYVSASSTSRICIAFCQSDRDCPVLGSCDAYTGTCGKLGDHPGTGDVGAPCNSDLECISGVCFTPSPIFPGGYCTAFCSVERQGCPSGSSCGDHVKLGADLGVCYQRCTADSDCRASYGCFPANAPPHDDICSLG